MRNTRFGLFLFLFFLQSCALNQTREQVHISTPDHQRIPANFQSCFEVMNAMIKHNKHFTINPSLLVNAKNLDELEAAYGNESLISLQRSLSDKQIKDSNIHVRNLLRNNETLSNMPEKTTFVTASEAKVILDAITNSKVNKNHYCYDPENKTGFCFGRAIIGHMEALARGVHPEAVKKIWIAGDMKEWGHHVAPMVKTNDGWLVLDTNIGRPVSTEEWINYYRPMKAANAKDIMVFVSQPGRFGPYDSEAYNAVNLFNTVGNTFNRENDFYKGYFHDYFEALDNDSSIKKFPIR